MADVVFPQQLTFGTHAVALYNAEAVKSQVRRSATAPQGYLILITDAAPQDRPYQPQPQQLFPPLVQPPHYPNPLRTVVAAGPQFWDHTLPAQQWPSVLTPPPQKPVPLRTIFASPQLFDHTLSAQWQSALPSPIPPFHTTCGAIDIYDKGNGSALVAWPAFGLGVGGSPPASYNVYVNGVLKASATVRQAIITGLVFSSYDGKAVTPSGQYVIKVVAVKSGGAETACSLDHALTSQPTSQMLVTPMRRPFPFPNT